MMAPVFQKQVPRMPLQLIAPMHQVPTPLLSKHPEDTVATGLIPDDLYEPLPKRMKALKSTGDGNCLYSSVSIALRGDESLSHKLCEQCLQELVENFPLYEAALKARGLSYHDPLHMPFVLQCVLETDCFSQVTMEPLWYDCIMTNTASRWSSLHQCMALATILCMPIYSVYPPDEAQCIRHLLHGVIYSVRALRKSPLLSKDDPKDPLFSPDNHSVVKNKWTG